MAKTIPDDIRKDLEKACLLHEKAVSDYSQCLEFNKLMSEILVRLEGAHCYGTADKVMSVLLVCNPNIGARCEQYSGIVEVMKKFQKVVL